MKINATWFGLMAILFWSTSIGLMRTITESLGASAGAAIIYTLGGLLIICFKGVPKVWQFSKLYSYGCGAIFIIYEILLSQSIGYAQDRQQTLEVTLLNYAWPCFTVIGAIIFKLQKSNKLIWLGIALAFLGIIYSLTEGNLTFIHSIVFRIQLNPIPYLFAFSAAILWALFCCITRKYGKGEDATSVFLFMTGVFLWCKYFIFDNTVLTINFSVGLEVIFLSLAMALGYSFWNYGIQKGNILLLSIMSYFTPLLSIFWSSLWLGVALSVAFWLGMLMVTGGSLLCYWGSRKSSLTK